jgi:hypothetical protein
MSDKGGFWATPLDLERCLHASISEWVRDYRLKSPIDRGAVPVAIDVVQGFVPSFYAGPEAPDQDKAPVIAVRATQGYYLRGEGKCEVNVMILTWDDDPNRQGYMDVQNLMARIAHHLLYFRLIGNFVLTDDPIHFMEVIDSFKDFFPYFVGGMNFQFTLRSSSPPPMMASLGVVVKQPQYGIEGGQEGWQDVQVQPDIPNTVPESPDEA